MFKNKKKNRKQSESAQLPEQAPAPRLDGGEARSEEPETLEQSELEEQTPAPRLDDGEVVPRAHAADSSGGPETPEQPEPAEPAAAEGPAVNRGFLPNLEEVLATSTSRYRGSEEVRPGVGYTLIPEALRKLVGESIPPQKKLMLTIVNQAIADEPHVVSEPALHALVKAAFDDGRLKTRQEPWHIWRYYRVSLMEAGILKEVPVEAEVKAA